MAPKGHVKKPRKKTHPKAIKKEKAVMVDVTSHMATSGGEDKALPTWEGRGGDSSHET